MKKGSFLRQLWNWFLVLIALVISGFMIIVPLTWQEQAFVGLATLALVIVLNRISKSQLITITMMALSAIATTRYAYFRIEQTIEGMTTAGHASSINNFFVLVLLFAEMYAFMTLYLGHFQTIRPLRRKPAPLPDDSNEWPTVDVYVPTYNEPLYVVRPTVLAALNMDWPSDKFKVYILDDGRREEFRQFAEAAGCGYIIRSQNDHRRPENINQALTKTDGDFIAIFDCDHTPTRSFLQITMGWFLKDQRLGMLQTPHHFYSPDPFEKTSDSSARCQTKASCFTALCRTATTSGIRHFSAVPAPCCAAPRCWKLAGSQWRRSPRIATRSAPAHAPVDDRLYRYPASRRAGYGKPFQPTSASVFAGHEAWFKSCGWKIHSSTGSSAWRSASVTSTRVRTSCMRCRGWSS